MGPIIDPDKTNAWLAGMRGVFADNVMGTAVIVALTLAFLAVVFVFAWQAAHTPRRRI